MVAQFISQESAKEDSANDALYLHIYRMFLGGPTFISAFQTESGRLDFDSEIANLFNLTKSNINAIARDFLMVMHSVAPAFEEMHQQGIALIPSDKCDSPISQEWVHKNKIENVLISISKKQGGMHLFNVFETSDEFQFDHASDHVQGMLLMEAVRQASINFYASLLNW